jgi:hypothetical protein
MDVASKMPLLISLPLPTKAEHNSRKKCTNIPEVDRQNNAMFQKFKSVWQFFIDGKPKGQPAHTQAALNERKAEG